jgi:uncharacterized protein YjbI with pentapeptide repeats
MISKTILVGLVAIAFVAGSIMTGTMVDAKLPAITLNDVYAVVTDIQTKVGTLLTNVATLQTTSNDIKAKTDNLPSDPASNSHIDTAIASIPSGGTNCITIDVNRDGHVDKYEISPGPHTEVNYADCYLHGVDLHGEYLFFANFNHADLSNSNLSGANLKSADLRDANLSGANLSGVNLETTNLTGADLGGAILSGANLNHAGFIDVNLGHANLDGANLEGTYFQGANLVLITYAGCTGTPNPIGIPLLGTLPVCTP